MTVIFKISFRNAVGKSQNAVSLSRAVKTVKTNPSAECFFPQKSRKFSVIAA